MCDKQVYRNIIFEKESFNRKSKGNLQKGGGERETPENRRSRAILMGSFRSVKSLGGLSFIKGQPFLKEPSPASRDDFPPMHHDDYKALLAWVHAKQERDLNSGAT